MNIFVVRIFDRKSYICYMGIYIYIFIYNIEWIFLKTQANFFFKGLKMRTFPRRKLSFLNSN
jgi:hypothetical protein